MTRLGLTLIFCVLAPVATVVASDGVDPVAKYGVPGALAAAMAIIGFVIRSSLTRQLDAVDRLSRALLIVAMELSRRPCIMQSEALQQLAKKLLEQGARDVDK